MFVFPHTVSCTNDALISSLQYEQNFAEEERLRLVESIERNAKHYIDVFSQAVDKVMPKETKEIS